MNYEKKYNEALERARISRLQLLDIGEEATEIEHIFPELHESEDEKIRKQLIEIVNKWKDGCRAWDSNHNDCNKIISWLEKQKPVEHFELKAGHWYFCHQAYCCRADDLTVKEGERFMCEKDGVVKGFIIKDPEKYFIEIDASESYNEEQKPENITSELASDEETDIQKAHREGRNDGIEMVINYPEEYGLQKQCEWSNEDKKISNAIYQSIDFLALKSLGVSEDDVVAWLESLKPQPKQEWSEEDEKMRSSTIFFLNEFREVYKDDAQKCIAWLNSLKPQAKCEKQKWSDEDEKIRKSLIQFFMAQPVSNFTFNDFTNMDYIAWLEKQKTDNVPQKDWAEPKQGWSREEEYVIIERVEAYKKGLKKAKEAIVNHPEEYGLQKLVEWSEEDEIILSSLIKSLQGEVVCFTNKDYIYWLKSIKERVFPQSKQK